MRRTALEARGIRTRSRVLPWTLVPITLFVLSGMARAQPAPEMTVKAAFVSKFPQFVTMPDVTATPDEVGELAAAFTDMVSHVERVTAEREEVLARELKASRLNDEFLAALSHELRTPLNAIMGWVQILAKNLLSNAVKFTPAGGHVAVELSRNPAGCRIEVTDTGIGIADDFLPEVFKRFRQGDGSTTRQHGGLGLGLALVKELAELHGGSVTASSAGAGRGSTFTVHIPDPVQRGAAARRPAGRTPQAASEFTGRPA